MKDYLQNYFRIRFEQILYCGVNVRVAVIHRGFMAGHFFALTSMNRMPVELRVKPTEPRR